MTPGRPATGYAAGKRSSVDNSASVVSRRYASVVHTTFVVHPHTARAAYHKLKKAAEK
jgi:hypothetical protein